MWIHFGPLSHLGPWDLGHQQCLPFSLLKDSESWSEPITLVKGNVWASRQGCSELNKRNQMSVHIGHPNVSLHNDTSYGSLSLCSGNCLFVNATCLTTKVLF